MALPPLTKTGQEAFQPNVAGGMATARGWATEMERRDALLSTYFEAFVDGSIEVQGGWDASSGAFPGGGDAETGQMWLVTTAGTTGGVTFVLGDRLIALTDNASTSTYAGNWLRIPSGVVAFVRGTDAGAGTANAVQVTTDYAVEASGGQLIGFVAFRENEGPGVTVSFNGGTPLPVRLFNGNTIAAGDIPAGSLLLGSIAGGQFRLSNDPSSWRNKEAAEIAQALAEAAAQIATTQAGIATTQAGIASAAAAAAIAAAEASGDVLFFDTFAAADAAKGSMPDLQVVRIFADETKAGRMSWYRLEGGVLVHKPVSLHPKVIFVSPSGSDSATGLTPAATLQTLAAAAAVATAGDTVRLERGGKWRETASFVAGVVVEPYGAGERPIISGQDVVSSFTIEDAGPAYRFSISLPAGTTGRAYSGVWEDGLRLREYRIGRDSLTDNAGVIAAVQANPGSFGFLGWSTNPAADVSGGWTAGTKDYVIHASDGGNPNSNGKTYEAYKREFATNGLGLYRGIRIQSGFHHDGSSQAMEGGTIERLARHGNLPIVPQFTGVTVIDPNLAYGGGADFHSNPNSAQRDVVYDRCASVGNDTVIPPVGIGFYAHGDFTGLNPIRQRATLRDSRVYFKSSAITLADVARIDVHRMSARANDQHVGLSPHQIVTLHDCDMRGGRGGTGVGGRQTSNHLDSNQLNIRAGYHDWRGQRFFETGSIVRNIDIEDAMLVFRPARISANPGALARSTGALTDLKLRRSIIVGMGENTTFEWLTIATSVSGVEFRDLLIVGQTDVNGAPRRGESLINGVNTPALTVDASAKVFGIDRSRVVLSDGPEGVKLRDGHYRPGDWTFDACAASPGNNQPRGHVMVGDQVLAASGHQLQLSVAYTPAERMRAAAYMATGTRFIACGNAGLFLRSATGDITGWEPIATGVSDNLHGLAANGAVIVAVGAAGAIVRSDDSGATWAEITDSGPRYTANDLWAVACNGSTWIAAGASGTVLRSTDDGATWTASTVGTQTFRACFRSTIASLFILGGAGGVIYTSTDGASWTERTTRTPNTIRAIAEADGEIIGVMQQTSRHTDTFISSANGTDWTVLPGTMPFEVLGVAGGGAMASLSNQHAMFCVGEAQSLGWRRRGGWNVQRVGASVPQMGTDTMAQWLARVV